MLATVLMAYPGAVVCGLTAAALLELPLPVGYRGGVIEVAVGRSSPAPRGRGLRGRRLDLPPRQITRVRGVATTTAARTFADLAAELALEDLVALGDVIVARGLASRAQLLAYAVKGRRGVIALRAAVALLDPHSASPQESRWRVRFHLARLPRPELNFDVIAAWGWLARVDFAWPRYLVAVEYDGRIHLTDAQRQLDAQRRNQLQQAGWLVIVLTSADSGRTDHIVELVRDALTARGWSA